MTIDSTRAGTKGRRPSFRNAAYARVSKGQEILQKWPRGRGKKLHPKTKEQMAFFRQVQWAWKYSSAWVQRSFTEAVHGTPLMPRDLFLMAVSGRMHRVIDANGRSWWSVAAIKNISDSLDVIAQLPGQMLFRRADRWGPIQPGTEGYVLTYQSETDPPTWEPPSGGGAAIWGAITGTLADQSDLQAALDAIAAAAAAAAEQATWGNISGTMSAQADLQAALDALSAALADKAGLDVFTATANGLVPFAGPSVGNFLRDDATWHPASGSGGISPLALLGGGALPGGLASYTIGGIDQGFRDLILVTQTRCDAAISAGELVLQFNGDTGNNYDWFRWNHFGTASAGPTSACSIGECCGTSLANNKAIGAETVIYGYSDSRWQKRTFTNCSAVTGDGAAAQIPEIVGGEWRNSNPIVSLTVKPPSGHFVEGSVIKLYGRW